MLIVEITIVIVIIFTKIILIMRMIDTIILQ